MCPWILSKQSSSKLTVFWEQSSRKTVCFSDQRMSVYKILKHIFTLNGGNFYWVPLEEQQVEAFPWSSVHISLSFQVSGEQTTSSQQSLFRMNYFLNLSKPVKNRHISLLMYFSVTVMSHFNNLQKPYQIFFQQHLVTESAADHNSPWYVLYKE